MPPKVAGEHLSSVNLESVVARGMTLEELEHEYIGAIMASVEGNKTEAATLLGLDRKTSIGNSEPQIPSDKGNRAA